MLCWSLWDSKLSRLLPGFEWRSKDSNSRPLDDGRLKPRADQNLKVIFLLIRAYHNQRSPRSQHTLERENFEVWECMGGSENLELSANFRNDIFF